MVVHGFFAAMGRNGRLGSFSRGRGFQPRDKRGRMPRPHRAARLGKARMLPKGSSFAIRVRRASRKPMREREAAWRENHAQGRKRVERSRSGPALITLLLRFFRAHSVLTPGSQSPTVGFGSVECRSGFTPR
jgi:hypothetical protein